MKVKTIRDTVDASGIEILEGSTIYVEKQTKKYYIGQWPHMCVTLMVKVPVKDCRVIKVNEIKLGWIPE